MCTFTFSTTETHKQEIRVSSASAPVPPVEPPSSVRSDTGSQTDVDGLTTHQILLIRKNGIKKTIEVPARINSHKEFVDTITRIHEILVGLYHTTASFDQLTSSTYYLLGWLVGDAGKDFGSERLMTARINLGLSRRHPENLSLVMERILCGFSR